MAGPFRSRRWIGLFFIPLLLAAAPGKESVSQRRQAVNDLVQKPDPAGAPKLIAALSDQDAYVRILALRGLALLHHQEASDKVAGILEADKVAEVRQAAAQALSSIRGAAARPALEKALRDPAESVRVAAANALSALRDPESIPALETLAQDPSLAVRRSAAAALTLMGTQKAHDALKAFEQDSDPIVRQIATTPLEKKAQ